MANRVYDKEGNVDSSGIINPDDQIRQLEQNYNTPSAEKPDSGTSSEESSGSSPVKNPDSRAAAGKSKAENVEKSKLDNQIGNGFQGKGAKPKADKKKSRANLKKKLGIFGGGLASLYVIGAVALLFFLSSLKIPNLMANIRTFEFARLSRDFNSALSNVTEEKLTLDASDAAAEGLYKNIVDKYGTFRSSTWGKLDKFRPQKILENFEATGKIEYLYKRKPGAITGIPREVIDGVKINGKEIVIGESAWYKYFEKRTDRLQFSGEMAGQLEILAKKEGTLFRGSVAKLIREKVGMDQWRWETLLSPTYKDAADIKDLSRLQGEANEVVKTAEALATEAAATKIESQQIAEAVVAAKKKAAECIQNPTCLENYLSGKGDQLERDVYNEITLAVESGTLSDLLSLASTVYSIALPVCMIYEGSTFNSGPTVAANSARSIKAFNTVAAADGQMRKDGKFINSREVQGLNDQIGNISNAPSELRASGKIVSPDNYTSPQANQSMTFTLNDALFGKNHPELADILNKIIEICPTITDIKTAAGLAVIETLGTIFTGGLATAESETVKLTTTQFLREMAAKTFTMDFAKKFAKRAVFIDIPIIVGGSYLAKWIVYSKMGNTMQPIMHGEEMQAQVDQGANLYANELGRKQLYGKTLSKSEIVASNYMDLQDIAFTKSKESIYEKYFNPNNPTSTLVNMAVGLDGTFSRSFVSIVGEFFSSLGSIFHPSSSIFTNLLTGNQHKALAAQTSAPYNIIQWGWSADELSRIRNNPDLYSPLNLSQRLESVTPEAQKLIDDKYSPCYTKEVGELLAQGSITREDNGSIIQQPEPNREGTDCSPDTLGSTEAFEWRLHKRYNAVLDHGISIADLTPTTTSGVILNSSGVDCGALIDILNPGSAAAYDQCMGTTGAP